MIKAINQIIENGKKNKNGQAEIINLVARYVSSVKGMNMQIATSFAKSQVLASKNLNVK